MRKTVLNQQQVLSGCGCLDLEINPAGRVYKIGAVLDGHTFARQNCALRIRDALQDLDAFLQPADFLLGHNLLGHDLPALRLLAPGLHLLAKPAVDTLFLSPLAFPENPYHRLVKGYKLVRDAVNDPVADARLAATLFLDQWGAFAGMRDRVPDLLSFYLFCFATEGQFTGIQAVFESLGAKRLNLDEAVQSFCLLAAELVCRTGLAGKIEAWLRDAGTRPALAYCLAWLRVAGGNSVLPPWVRHHFALVTTILRELRDSPCHDRGCVYCRDVHNSTGQLKRFFGFDDFRAQPADAKGESLQRAVVEEAMSDRSLLAILPTGGGKSLCYQLPALIRYQRRGVLTIVISPLQALMKDQVDNMRNRTGTPSAAALYGMLTPPQRGEVLQNIRLGDIGILYISPEQLRNRSFGSAIRQREIGCWVFDEAHCLSKWGHDFRTDYLYAVRFIKEFAEKQKMAIPAIQCFTATAKVDVKQEILTLFQEKLGRELRLFESGVERDNLHFEVQEVSGTGKVKRVHELLTERLGDNGSAIVYCSTRKATESLAGHLARQGWEAAAFHAGLEAPAKQHIQENFLQGAIRIICATNAFGMGIDKDNVRLVIHADIPGSLENYLQEAGRAGRDRQEADCILLFDEQDIESQFAMSAFSRLSRRDIAQVLRGLRSAKRDPDGDVVLTPTELLRSERVETSFDLDDPAAGNKVYTAVSWLERAGFVERNENHTQVFQGRPRVRTMDEARDKIRRLHLSAGQEQRWLLLLETLINAGKDQSFSADQLAEQLPPLAESARPEDATRLVLRTLHDMAAAGLIRTTLMLSAFVRYKVQRHSPLLLERICNLEQTMLDLMEQEAPDAEPGQWQNLSLRQLNQRLLDLGQESSNPESLRNLLVSVSRDGQGLAGQRGSIDFKHYSRDNYRVRLQRDWQSLRKTVRRRSRAASVILAAIMARVPPATPASAQVLVEFSAEDLLTALRGDLVLISELTDPLAAMDRALMFLHEQRVITLQHGLGVFRQAMTIRVQPGRRAYTRGDFAPLAHHYNERIFQVHVMNEYARQGAGKIARALHLVLAYFSMNKMDFVRRFFPGREEILERATSRQSFQQIVEALRNPEQESLVAAPEARNILVLAGPGSGKTRVVVHRCAYLLRVERVPARSILVLCFNRNAVSSLRRRLRQLAGADARGVAVYTYHGLAMRLTGRSLATAGGKREEQPDFANILQQAVDLLKGKIEIDGLEADEYRDRLLSGWHYILVDEYQDIDQAQYELVSALSGRTLDEQDNRLTIMAVGDDDQNIYSFRGTGVEFIRRFQDDYQAEVRFLVENYRSSAHIIAAANMMIRQEKIRMKAHHPIRINRQRRNDPAGGRWTELDPFGRGRVQCVEVPGQDGQAVSLMASLRRLQGQDSDFHWQDCAVLAREWAALSPVRALCEEEHVPVEMIMDSGILPPLHRIREFSVFLERLRRIGDELVSGPRLAALLEEVRGRKGNRWWHYLERLLNDWRRETDDGEVPVTLVTDFLYETLYEQRQNRLTDNALFLGTVHAAKGLEFKHVFILDGGWNRAVAQDKTDEERRLLYVGMTRAMQTLTLYQFPVAGNPFPAGLNGDFLLRLSAGETAESPCPALGSYTVLGLQDVNLGFAGRRPSHDPIHARLAALQPGDPLEFREQGDRLLLLSGHLPVAALSQKAAAEWRGRLDTVATIRVLAMVSRTREDGAPEFRKLYRTERWEVPVVEILTTGSP
ncbi:ATP-dependent DNA helicase RecQ [bacterium BMS3Abin13]|nr:ATP-dependent DNA helicase RecQ [bacterium BMS3Abin13]